MSNVFLAFSNPYFGKSFGEFFITLFARIVQALKGNLSLEELASDEIQILVLFFLSLSCSFIGTFLVLKKMTMLANSLSHTILLGIIVTYLILHPGSFVDGFKQDQFLSISTLFVASLFTGLITSILTHFLNNVARLQEDASIGLVFTTLFALAVTLVTVFTKNMHIGTEAIMGNIDALHFQDVKIVFWMSGLTLIFFTIFFKEFSLFAFDAQFARASGLPVSGFGYLLMVFTSAAAICAFRAVGVLLFLAILVCPVLAARLFSKRLKNVISLSFMISAICAFTSVALSRHFLSVYGIPLSTSALFIVVLGIFYFLCLLYVSRNSVLRNLRKNLSHHRYES